MIAGHPIPLHYPHQHQPGWFPHTGLPVPLGSLSGPGSSSINVAGGSVSAPGFSSINVAAGDSLSGPVSSSIPEHLGLLSEPVSSSRPVSGGSLPGPVSSSITEHLGLQSESVSSSLPVPIGSISGHVYAPPSVPMYMTLPPATASPEISSHMQGSKHPEFLTLPPATASPEISSHEGGSKYPVYVGKKCFLMIFISSKYYNAMQKYLRHSHMLCYICSLSMLFPRQIYVKEIGFYEECLKHFA